MEKSKLHFPPSPTQNKPQPPIIVVFESQLVTLGVSHCSNKGLVSPALASLPRALRPPRPGRNGAPAKLNTPCPLYK